MRISKHIVGYSSAVAVGLIIGISGSSTPSATTVAAPAVTRTVTAPAVTVTVPAAPTTSDSSLTETALEVTWDGMPSGQRREICDGWGMAGGAAQDYLLDAFMNSAGGDFDRATVKAFFDGKC